jgi:hypothetical protein
MRKTLTTRLPCSIFFLLLGVGANAQEFRFEPAEIPVEINGFTVNSPFLGSLSSERVKFVDINNDGDLDFFSAPVNGSIRYFRNVGTPTNLRLRFEPDLFSDIIIGNDFGFADIDNDGDFDLFVLNADRMSFYINKGTPSEPEFELVSNSLLSGELEGAWAFSFSDIDHDADFDLFIGHNNIGKLSFFENTGTPAQASFLLKDGLVDFIKLEYWSMPVLADIDHDRDFDLFVGVNRFGFFTGGGIRFCRNVGNLVEPTFHLEQVDFIPRLVSEPNPYHAFADINDDGILELFVSNGAGNIDFYQNDEGTQSENYSLATGVFISLDAGFDSSPSLTDIDKDGDLDLFKVEATASLSRGMGFYENEGDPANPMFALKTIPLPNFTGNALYVTAASFGDLDSDGDSDFVFGELTGRVVLNRNVGSNTAPRFVIDSILTVLGSATLPAFVDIDADNDLDLFVGTGAGQLYFYRNTGDVSRYDFRIESDHYLSESIARPAPFFIDVDQDNDFDLLLGNGEGTIHFYRNTGSPQQPDFLLESGNYTAIDVGSNSTIYAGDIDNDGDPDLFTGNLGGGIGFYRNDSLSSSVPEPETLPERYELRQNYPNPFNALTNFQYELPKASSIKLTIFNLLGQQVINLVDKTQEAGVYRVKWNGKDGLGKDVAGSIYVHRLETNDFVKTKRLVLLR